MAADGDLTELEPERAPRSRRPWIAGGAVLAVVGFAVVAVAFTGRSPGQVLVPSEAAAPSPVGSPIGTIVEGPAITTTTIGPCRTVGPGGSGTTLVVPTIACIAVPSTMAARATTTAATTPTPQTPGWERTATLRPYDGSGVTGLVRYRHVGPTTVEAEFSFEHAKPSLGHNAGITHTDAQGNPFLATVCEVTTNAAGKGECHGTVTIDADRTIANATVFGYDARSGGYAAVATATFTS